ncbi:regulator of chromosome condensation domain-containing protein [Heterostelium album PN500]|uniref:Regulator of chromosome condensation domain-containing protein n=1 Tax=Heterostelium pallidum (strain ATCC 26659 / Pp 5 / PN500) TaxID=670386 RepID=D3B5Y6_HETP5|nr:regulator of chromosome condensation domain-containing protein [Heterostelium album PN500]EFA83284.1 regulator of chromosome condensation domain-containing protein [Heterostelium album PN500]|eukprot:XP_020435401.1 regulator of chromosome condensation domain-containing protein [Heterostelium album PN500]
MSVISFGVGKQGQLGLDVNKDQLDPAVIQLLKGKRIKQIACGEAHSLAVTEFGDVYSWGRGKEGELGHPQKAMTAPPALIKALEHERIVKVACGNYHSLALTDTGKVYQWGQLHEIDATKSGVKSQGGLVEMTGIKSFASKVADHSLSMYLNGEKAAYDEESASSSVLQDNPTANGLVTDDQEEEEEFLPEAIVDTQQEQQPEKSGSKVGEIVDKNQMTPVLVDFGSKSIKIVDISAGWAYSAAVTSTGNVYTWGFNEKGQLGLGDRWYHGNPRVIRSLSNKSIVNIACGRQHMAAISKSGDLYTWGLGVFGQLGHGKLKSLLHPKKVLYFEQQQKKIVQVATGANFTMAVSENGELFSFGHGEYGQLGATEDTQYMDWNNNGDRDDHLKYSLPKQVKALESVKVRKVACGHLHTIAVTTDNDVYTWGWGSSGCLGFGDRKFQLVPQRVPSLSGEEISSVSGGEKHTLIVRSSDTTTFAFDYKQLVNDQKTGDIAFLVQNKYVYAHKLFIRSRCPKLYGSILFSDRFCKNKLEYIDEDGHMEQEGAVKKAVVEIAKVKYQIWVSFMTYLYTDHLVIAPHLRKELSDVAAAWGVSRLVSLCHRYNYKLRLTDKIPPSSFSTDITEHIDSFDFSDIHFEVANKEFIPSHKLILGARNHYFKTMFECGFREKDQLNFNIGNDIEKESFKLMIEYIYGNNEAVVNQENAVELLCLSDRFMVEDLKLVAESFLESMVRESIQPILTTIKPSSPIQKDQGNSSEQTSPDSAKENISEDAIISFENICLLLQVSDKFLAKRLKRFCMETIAHLISTKQMTFFFDILKKVRYESPQLIRELDHFASLNTTLSANQLISLIR